MVTSVEFVTAHTSNRSRIITTLHRKDNLSARPPMLMIKVCVWATLRVKPFHEYAVGCDTFFSEDPSF